ncbi:CCL14 protein, partial [Amia calva]|nr:CCL14 protein [Amia calva]
MKMRSVRPALPFCLLVLLGMLALGEGLRMANGPRRCCYKFAERQLPRGRIVSYSKTSLQCTNPGVLFKMQAGQEVCARASDRWVLDYVKFFDSKSQKIVS